MPTGYTAKVQSGEMTTLEDFVWCCARAFGALIDMRDAPTDAEIPTAFMPSDYHSDELLNAQETLDDAGSWDEGSIRREAEASYTQALTAWRSRAAEKDAEGRRYKAMLTQVEAWTPPSDEHAKLKAFMVSQLGDSIEFDTGYTEDEPERPDWVAWYDDHMSRLRGDVNYHKEKHEEEVARARGRTEWVQKLRDSFESVPA